MNTRMKTICILFLFAALSLHSQEAPRPRILGLAHISLFAHDYEKSRAFYRDFLGFEEPYTLKNADGSPSMTFFKINDRQFIEISPEREVNSDRLNHYALETDNAEALRKYLAERGVNVPDHVPKGRIGNLNFMIQDPEGHSVEIVEYPRDSQTSLTRGKFASPDRISEHLKHAGIIVTDFGAESDFYTRLLGFTETWRGSNNAKLLSWVNLKVPDGNDYIEFMLHKEAVAPDKRGTAHHLSLEVADASVSAAKLNARPYRQRFYMRAIEIRTGVNRKRQVNLFDPDGTRTELMEPGTVDGKPAPSSNLPPPAMVTMTAK
jgi:catechol 2,3-dioxygenase-like lactoylglutathione lyase family enzyme